MENYLVFLICLETMVVSGFKVMDSKKKQKCMGSARHEFLTWGPWDHTDSISPWNCVGSFEFISTFGGWGERGKDSSISEDSQKKPQREKPPPWNSYPHKDAQFLRKTSYRWEGPECFPKLSLFFCFSRIPWLLWSGHHFLVPRGLQQLPSAVLTQRKSSFLGTPQHNWVGLIFSKLQMMK